MFRIGQRVVCVDDTELHVKRLEKGETYTVAEYNTTEWSEPIVRLYELPDLGDYEAVYAAFRFRPLDDNYAEGVLSEIKKSTLDETLELLEQIKTKETVK